MEGHNIRIELNGFVVADDRSSNYLRSLSTQPLPFQGHARFWSQFNRFAETFDRFVEMLELAANAFVSRRHGIGCLSSLALESRQ